MEVGSLAEWFGAVGTVAGVFVTGIGLVREAKRRRADIAALRRAEEDRLAGQARLVFTRVHIRGLASVELAVMNESAGPILNLTARLLATDEDIAGRLSLISASAHADRLDAHSFCELSIDLGVDDELVLLDDIATELRFTDMAGLVWIRRENGDPERVLPDPRQRAAT